jgi:hypothetical protein
VAAAITSSSLFWFYASFDLVGIVRTVLEVEHGGMAVALSIAELS